MSATDPNTTDTLQTVLQTAAQTAIDVAPTALAAGVGVAAVADPRVGVALQIGAAALPFLQQAAQMVQSKALTPDQYAALWAQVGANVLAEHNAWVAGTTAQPATAP